VTFSSKIKWTPLASCAAFAGIFVTLISYLMVFGMGDDAVALGNGSAPFGDVAARSGMGMLVGGLWFAVLRAKSPQTLISIQHDLEG
jgi:hypothetical protein